MRHAGAVRGRQRGCNLRGQIECLGNLNRATLDALAQSFAFDELRGNERTKLTLANLVNGDDIRMV